MESIKKYFRTALIGLATFILSTLQVNNQVLDKQTEKFEDDDFHMFI